MLTSAHFFRHMLFTGITSDLLNMVQSIMAKAKRKTKFNQLFTKLLQQINSFGLDWIKCGELPNTQWASENYIAIARIFSFLIGFYCHHLDPYHGGITHLNMHHLHLLSNSFQTMIASLMRVDGGVTPEMLDSNIKLFLSCWNKCEGEIDLSEEGKAEGSASGIFQKGNFLSLLNVPDQVRNFGPLRHYFEGNNEFYIQKIKKCVDHVRFSQPFFERKMVRHKQSELLSFMKKQIREKEQGKWKAKRYYRHRSVDEVEAALSAGTALSVVKFANNNSALFVCADRSRLATSSRFVKIVPDGVITEICGVNYCRFRLDVSAHSQVVFDKETLEEMLQLADCGVLMSFGGDNHPGHTLITDTWKILDIQGVLSYPAISKNLFSSN